MSATRARAMAGQAVELARGASRVAGTMGRVAGVVPRAGWMTSADEMSS